MEEVTMRTFLQFISGSLLALGLFTSGAVLADSPVRIDAPDRHSVEVKGKISLYRVQVEGMNFGVGRNKTHAEVLVALDSQPGKVFTLALAVHDGKDTDSVVNQEIANTLRLAYLNRLPVTLYHQITTRKDNNFKILVVQLD
jgi:predicted permease